MSARCPVLNIIMVVSGGIRSHPAVSLFPEASDFFIHRNSSKPTEDKHFDMIIKLLIKTIYDVIYTYKFTKAHIAENQLCMSSIFYISESFTSNFLSPSPVLQLFSYMQCPSTNIFQFLNTNYKIMPVKFLRIVCRKFSKVSAAFIKKVIRYTSKEVFCL